MTQLRLKGFRFGAPYSIPVKDLDEAVAQAVFAVDENMMLPETVVDEAGVVVLDKGQLNHRMDTYAKANGYA